MLLITLLAVAGLVGTVVRQFPAFSLHDAGAYADQLADMHRRWDTISLAGFSIGPGMVGLFDQLSFFRVFSAWWFLLLLSVLTLAIICCTLNRTPKLWRQVRTVRVEQPAPFFDLRLPDRALFEHAEPLEPLLVKAFRRRHFRVREAVSADGAERWIHGDRNQYLKLATLLTHLGLVLFLAGGAVTVGFGFETVIFVGEGQTAPVQPVGTPDNLLVKVIDFQAPQRPDGSFVDFRTDLAVYRDGRQVARKTIRVNDPLEVDGFVFHQNTFGPSADLEIHDPDGRLVWTGPVLLAGQLAGLPQGFLTIPGTDMGLLIVLTRLTDGSSLLGIQGLGTLADTGESVGLFTVGVGVGGTTDPTVTAGYTITWTRAGAWTGMVVKNDPGQSIIWLAFLSLISGLVLSFYFPRRRVWARIADGRVQIAMLGDRYVDVPRELGGLLDDLAARSGQRAAMT